MFPRLSPEGQAPGLGAGGGAGPSRDRGKRGRPSPRSLRPRVPAAPRTLSRGSHRAPRKAVTGCGLRWPPRRTRPRSPQIPRRCHRRPFPVAVVTTRTGARLSPRTGGREQTGLGVTRVTSRGGPRRCSHHRARSLGWRGPGKPGPRGAARVP